MINFYEMLFEDAEISKIERVVTPLVVAETTMRTQRGDEVILVDAFAAIREQGSWLFLNNIFSPWSCNIGTRFSARVINYEGIYDLEIHFMANELSEDKGRLLKDFVQPIKEMLQAKKMILQDG